MGYAKAQMEKGFSSVGDTFVCADCFEDYANRPGEAGEPGTPLYMEVNNET